MGRLLLRMRNSRQNRFCDDRRRATYHTAAPSSKLSGAIARHFWQEGEINREAHMRRCDTCVVIMPAEVPPLAFLRHLFSSIKIAAYGFDISHFASSATSD